VQSAGKKYEKEQTDADRELLGGEGRKWLDCGRKVRTMVTQPRRDGGDLFGIMHEENTGRGPNPADDLHHLPGSDGVVCSNANYTATLSD
jgi:hypothetical protein